MGQLSVSLNWAGQIGFHGGYAGLGQVAHPDLISILSEEWESGALEFQKLEHLATYQCLYEINFSMK